jgi:hypothetical protein
MEMSWFIWQDKLDQIKTGDDFFKAAVFMGLLRRSSLIETLSLKKFNAVRKASISDVPATLNNLSF